MSDTNTATADAMRAKSKCRSKMVKFRVSGADLASIDRLATKSGRTRSEYIRRCALGRKLPPVVSEASLETVHQLRGVANNINQLARLLHSSPHIITNSQLLEVSAQLADLADVVADLRRDIFAGKS